MRSDLRRLDLDGLILAGFAAGSTPTLLPRGRRMLAAARGEHAAPVDD